MTRQRPAAVPRLLVGALILVGGCQASGPGPTAGGSIVRPSLLARSPGPAGLDWVTAATVERPGGMTATPPSVSPVTGGGLGHPGHFSGQGHPVAVARGGDRLIAAGYTFPDWHGVIWTSTDRQTWTIAELPQGGPDTFPLAVAGGADGRVVIVGRRAERGVVWLSRDDGLTWREASGDGFAVAPETRLTSVVAVADGFVAGGWSGLITEPGMAHIWTSADGARWTPLPDDPIFADGRIASIAAGPVGLVAVGTTGSVGSPSGAAAWFSRDGRRWQRAPDGPSLDGGVMRAVSAGPRPAFVAVGSNRDATAAMAWTSDDGLTWDPAPGHDSLTFHGLRIRMDGVTSGPAGFVAVGHFLFGSQYGQGSAWTSVDGRTWLRSADDIVAFGQAEPLAVMADGAERFVAVGTVGAPDNFIPSVWLSPSR